MPTDPTTIIAIAGTVYALFSEIIGLNKKWKSNSVVQAILSIGSFILKGRR